MGFLSRLFAAKPTLRITFPAERPRVHLTDGCLAALQQCLRPALARRHEGVAYLLGRTDGTTTTCTTVVRPTARTGPGFFQVSASAMAQVVELAMDLDLQVVAQVHTHPVDAFHSDGDEDGANIRYDGFVSIVLPLYGSRLPSFEGAAFYHHNAVSGWTLLDLSRLTIVPTGVMLDGR